ncbi:TetR/AcrR family transcriptional regulator [Amycolatopsis aidingensis]|uniref:TetR/AcrR family transcriptional regulator n=1 Tax=Amycolatopsis aidingensis TaxID=2842453 RepID=UPI001C0CBD3B|nr:TetR/AcrR family transcriptional regulator [Amycolatopsis aidingensis]
MDRQSGGRPRGRVDKRDAITRAARTVFSREGYARAGVEAIAAEAGVSTRTVYNHFEGKQQLFTALIEHSAGQVATALTTIIDRHLGTESGTDLDAALIALAQDWISPDGEFADHFAMVRHLTAEATTLPPEILAAWHQAGPQRAQQALARNFQHLADRGQFDITDADLAASHYIWTVLGEITSHPQTGAPPLTEDRKTQLITAGVHAFLNGYRPRPTRP